MASTSDQPRRAYVWVWLPWHTGPVLAGALEKMFDRQADIIRTQWDDAADAAELTRREADLLYSRQVMNEYALT